MQASSADSLGLVSERGLFTLVKLMLVDSSFTYPTCAGFMSSPFIDPVYVGRLKITYLLTPLFCLTFQCKFKKVGRDSSWVTLVGILG